VVDIDGTLLNREGIISDADRRALARAARAGLRVSLSTGRAATASRGILEQLSLDGYHMFFDGALVADPMGGAEVYAEPVSPDLVRRVVEFAQDAEMGIELYSSTHLFVPREDWKTEIRRSFFGIEPTVDGLGSLWRRERIVKGTIIVRSPEERAKARSFQRHFQNDLGFSWNKTPAYPDVDFINVLCREVSKGKALRKLASFLDLPLEEVAAIGDGANDLSLLSAAGIAIAMGNASDELKALADYVVPDVDHSGVATAIEKLLL
jgi:hypothetical protein